MSIAAETMGYDAGTKEYKGIGDNPFQLGSIAYKSWAKGFRNGRKEIMGNRYW